MLRFWSSPWLILVVQVTLTAQTAPADRAYGDGLRLHRSGDFEGAAREYRAALAADPARFDARSNLGAVLANLGRYQEAVVEYEGALRGAPAAAQFPLKLNLALAYYKSFEIPKASVLLAELHGQDPKNENVTLLLADCQLRQGRPKQVVDLLAPIEAAQPDNRALTYLLGMALIQGGEIAEGQKRVDKILRDGDSAEGLFLLAYGMYAARDFPGAVKTLQRAIALNPAVPSLQSLYGQALLETGDAEGAQTAFRQELALNPNDFDANLRLGQVLAQRRRMAEAQPYLMRAAMLRPGSGEAKAALDGKAAGPARSVGPAVGTAAPDFPQLGLGQSVKPKPTVLVFGSYTCPQFRGSAPALLDLSRKYGSRVRFLLVYIREAHADGQWQSAINEREGINMRPAANLEEKTEHLAICLRKLNLPFASVVDGMEGKIESAYSAWPSRVYLIGQERKVAYNSGLGELDFDAKELEAAIQSALKPR